MDIPLPTVSNQNRRVSRFDFDSRNRYKESLDSLYSSILNYSISISDSSSSADSVTIGKMQGKNKELLEQITSRVTAFIYFTKFNKENPAESLQSSIEGLENMHESIEKEIEHLNPEDQSFVLVSKILKDLSELKKCFEEEKNCLKSKQEELKSLETEESELCSRLQNIELKVSKLLLEQNSVKSSCQCRIY